MAKPIIEYPCEWSYSIIGTDEQRLKNAAQVCLETCEYRISRSNSSRMGKYIALRIETVVPDEQTRDRIHGRLADHPSVKMVL